MALRFSATRFATSLRSPAVLSRSSFLRPFTSSATRSDTAAGEQTAEPSPDNAAENPVEKAPESKPEKSSEETKQKREPPAQRPQKKTRVYKFNKTKPFAEFLESRSPYMVATYDRPEPVIVAGHSSYVWDLHGKKYLDFGSGIGVVSLGHSNTTVTDALIRQANTLIHASNLFHNVWTGTLSRNLILRTLNSGAMPGASQVFLSNSGTEANEAALKFARKVAYSKDPSAGKTEVVSFKGSFHGRTFGTLSATPNEKYQAPFEPLVPGFRAGTFNDVEAIPELINEKTCAVMVEPIQGEGGINVATPEFLIALRQRCDEVGALLIFDEVQCGLMRTGTFWAHANPIFQLPAASENEPPETAYPDILTSAKALGNGVPIGATIVSGESVGQHIQAGDHGTTFGGNALASCVAHTAVSTLDSRGVRVNMQKRASELRTELEALKKYPGVVEDVRGAGLMLGVQLAPEHVDRTKEVVGKAMDNGLIVLTAGKGCIRIMPPLTIGAEALRYGTGLLDKTFSQVFGKAPEVTAEKEESA